MFMLFICIQTEVAKHKSYLLRCVTLLYVLTSPAVNEAEALQRGCSNIFPKVGIYLPPASIAFQPTANFLSTAVRTLHLTNCLYCHEIVCKTGLNYQVRKLSSEIRNGYFLMRNRIVTSLAVLSPVGATTKTKKNFFLADVMH
jgi:hypothetical protein